MSNKVIQRWEWVGKLISFGLLLVFLPMIKEPVYYEPWATGLFIIPGAGIILIMLIILYLGLGWWKKEKKMVAACLYPFITLVMIVLIVLTMTA